MGYGFKYAEGWSTRVSLRIQTRRIFTENCIVWCAAVQRATKMLIYTCSTSETPFGLNQIPNCVITCEHAVRLQYERLFWPLLGMKLGMQLHVEYMFCQSLW